VRRDRDRLEKRIAFAERITAIARSLMTAVQMEVFDDVIKYADELTAEWQRRITAEGWDGLELLLRWSYPWFKSEATQPIKHREFARRQRDNLTRWSNWAATVIAAQKALDIAMKKLSKPLDIIKQTTPLKGIQEQCGAGIKACDDLKEVLADEPPEDPLSNKAEAERNKVPKEDWTKTVDGDKGNRMQLTRLRDDVRKQLYEFEKVPNGLLWRLDQAISNLKSLEQKAKQRRNAVPQQAIDNAVRCLADCRAVDPCHDRVTRHSTYLKSLTVGTIN
jgi:hypothetical protein